MERAMESSPRDPDAEDATQPTDGPEVLALLKDIEVQKRTYLQCTDRLKQVKTEIDSYKLVAEQNKERLQRDFEAWYLSLQASQSVADGVSTNNAMLSSRM